MKPHLRAKLKRLKIDMNELSPNNPPKKLLTRPGVKPTEVQALDILLTAVNNPSVNNPMFNEETGRMEKSDPTVAMQALPPGQLDAPAIDVPIRTPIVSTAADIGLGVRASAGPSLLVSAGPGPVGQTGTNGMPPDNNRLYFTGRLKVGKDTVATAAGCTIFGFADPMYAIATHFFKREFSSSAGKDLPGARAFLQAVGAIGRGVISEAYPLTPARASLEAGVRAAGLAGELCPGVDWGSYGSNNEIWLNAAILRVDAFLVENPGARVAITNVRFENERAALKAAGWSGWHCFCSPQTWSARLAKSKLTPQSPQINEITEKFAAELDAGLTKELSARRAGQKLRVIWTDELVQCPSNRLHTVESFLQLLNVQPPKSAYVATDDF